MLEFNLLRPKLLPVGELYWSASFITKNFWVCIKVIPSHSLSEYELKKVKGYYLSVKN